MWVHIASCAFRRKLEVSFCSLGLGLNPPVNDATDTCTIHLQILANTQPQWLCLVHFQNHERCAHQRCYLPENVCFISLKCLFGGSSSTLSWRCNVTSALELIPHSAPSHQPDTTLLGFSTAAKSKFRKSKRYFEICSNPHHFCHWHFYARPTLTKMACKQFVENQRGDSETKRQRKESCI